MMDKIKYLAKLKEEDWDFYRHVFTAKVDGLLKNMWVVIFIWGLLTFIPILFILKIKWTVPFIISYLLILVSVKVIKRNGSLFSKHIQVSIGSLYLIIMMFYQFYIISFYSDNATIPVNVFLIYTIVFIVLIISSPFVTYQLAKYEYEDENPNIETRKKPPKFITYTVFMLGAGSILVVIFNNFFSEEFQFSLFRVVMIFIMYMFVLVANSSLINALVLKINDKSNLLNDYYNENE